MRSLAAVVFPDVVDVLAMTTPATVLVVYSGEEEDDAWIDAVSDSVATRRTRRGRTAPPARRGISDGSSSGGLVARAPQGLPRLQGLRARR